MIASKIVARTNIRNLRLLFPCHLQKTHISSGTSIVVLEVHEAAGKLMTDPLTPPHFVAWHDPPLSLSLLSSLSLSLSLSLLVKILSRQLRTSD
jgi:hypothetical protein